MSHLFYCFVLFLVLSLVSPIQLIMAQTRYTGLLFYVANADLLRHQSHSQSPQHRTAFFILSKYIRIDPMLGSQSLSHLTLYL